jgi:hypothetical protein
LKVTRPATKSGHTLRERWALAPSYVSVRNTTLKLGQTLL